MNPKEERARRVVSYLEARTVANGCTEAEEAAARSKAKDIRQRYGIAQAEKIPAMPDALDVPLQWSGPTFDDLIASIIIEAETRAFGVNAKRRAKRKPVQRGWFFPFN